MLFVAEPEGVDAGPVRDALSARTPGHTGRGLDVTAAQDGERRPVSPGQ